MSDISITEEQRSIILSALTEKLVDTERYLRTDSVPETPRAEDLCCDYHRFRYEYRKETYKALTAQRDAVQDLIKLFEENS